MSIYIDMDEVLCGWNKASEELFAGILFHGKPSPVPLKDWMVARAAEEVWDEKNLIPMFGSKRLDVCSPLRQLVGTVLSDPTMEDWWATIEPTPFYDQIARFLDWLMPEEPLLLTTPIDHYYAKNRSCMRGKLRWAMRWMCGVPVLFAHDKSVYAFDKDDILIDDSQSNIGAWREAGGTGILIDHENTPVTTEWLKDQIAGR